MSSLIETLQCWLLGDDIAARANSADTSIQPTWEVPAGLALTGLIAAGAFFILLYWHETAAAGRFWKVLLAGIRTALAGLILLMLYGWTIQRHRTDLPDVVIMLDD